nr:MAG TPA: hypothetical protein [Caudoviricetes sp.]
MLVLLLLMVQKVRGLQLNLLLIIMVNGLTSV